MRDAERPAHPHLHRDLRHPHRAQAADGPRGRQGAQAPRRPSTLAKSYCDDVEFSLRGRDPLRSRLHRRGLRDRDRGGRDHVNIPDTVGYTTPEEFVEYFRRPLRAGSGSARRRDLGALPRRPGAGGRQLAGRPAGRRPPGRVRVNGIGERAGNCSLEEIVMLIKTHAEDVHGLATGAQQPRAGPYQPHGLPPDRLRGPAQQGGRRTQRLRARVRHPSGRRAEGAHRPTRSWTRPKSASSRTRSCWASTRAATPCATPLEQLGFEIEGNALNAAFKRFKEIADRKKQVTALDLEAIVSDEMRERADAHELAWFEVEAGSRREPLARVAVTLPSGEEVVGESSGDGPVDAIFHAIQKATGTDVRAAPVHGRGGDRGRGRARRGRRDAARRGAPGQRPRRGDRHPRGLARAYVRALSNALGRRDPRGRGGYRRGRRRAHPGALAPPKHR